MMMKSIDFDLGESCYLLKLLVYKLGKSIKL